MRDNENGRATRFHMHDGLGQRLLAGFVEVGVRLIQDNQARRAVDSTGQPDSLTLTTGEVDAVATDNRVITFRQQKNHFVNARNSCSSDHAIWVNIGKPGNVLADTAFEKLNILR